jgi:hypothetical protein
MTFRAVVLLNVVHRPQPTSAPIIDRMVRPEKARRVIRDYQKQEQGILIVRVCDDLFRSASQDSAYALGITVLLFVPVYRVAQATGILADGQPLLRMRGHEITASII